MSKSSLQNNFIEYKIEEKENYFQKIFFAEQRFQFLLSHHQYRSQITNFRDEAKILSKQKTSLPQKGNT